MVRTGTGVRNRGLPVRCRDRPALCAGGAAMARADIDHFEVRTFDGRRLVEIDT